MRCFPFHEIQKNRLIAGLVWNDFGNPLNNQHERVRKQMAEQSSGRHTSAWSELPWVTSPAFLSCSGLHPQLSPQSRLHYHMYGILHTKGVTQIFAITQGRKQRRGQAMEGLLLAGDPKLRS